MPETYLALHVLPEGDDGIVQLDPSEMRLLGVLTNDVVALVGTRTCYARAFPTPMGDRNQKLALVSPLLQRNTGTAEGNKITISSLPQKPVVAESVTLQVDDDLDRLHLLVREKNLGLFWHDIPVTVKDRLRVSTLDRNPLFAEVIATKPEGAVQIFSGTKFIVMEARKEETSSFRNLGGLRDVYRTCQSLAQARLRVRLGSAARSVLLTGPQGCGKALLVKRLAGEMSIPLFSFDMHQLIDKRLENNSQEVFVSLTELSKKGPAIVLLDHLEALMPCNSGHEAMALAARVVLSHILSLLEEVSAHPDLMVFGACCSRQEIRLQERLCFDLALPVDAPNRLERQEILTLAARRIPLEDDVDLARLAAMTSGMTGRDLCKLVNTASRLSQGTRVADSDFHAALRHIEPSAAQAVRCDIPDVPWNDVAGLDDTKRLLRETLEWSLRYASKFSANGVHPPRSILLSGAQGTGKTALVRALAGVIPLNFVEISCSLLTVQESGEAAQAIHESFFLARRKTPCLVFLDDVDLLFERSEDAGFASVPRPVVPWLLRELDGLSLLPGIMVIASTSRPDRLTLDVLQPGRFDFAVSLPMPDHVARKKILEIHARKLPLAADIDFDRLASATQGMTPADLFNLCNRAGLMALRQTFSGEHGGIVPPMVNAALFEQALRGRKG